jgi:hypothetical protein
MGMCPVRVGTNVPNIQGFYSIIFLEQIKNENGSQWGMSHRNYSLSECGMMGFKCFYFIRMMKRIPSCTDKLVPPYTQAHMPRWRKAIVRGGKSSTSTAINV